MKINLQSTAMKLLFFKLCNPQLTTSQQDLGSLKGQQIITQMISAFQLDYATKTHQEPLWQSHCNNLSQVDKLFLNTSQPITACLHTTKGNQTISQYGVSCFFNLHSSLQQNQIFLIRMATTEAEELYHQLQPSLSGLDVHFQIKKKKKL